MIEYKNSEGVRVFCSEENSQEAISAAIDAGAAADFSLTFESEEKTKGKRKLKPKRLRKDIDELAARLDAAGL